MKFGPVPTAEAVGAVLAHTHRLPNRRILKKGRLLSPEDILALQEGGLDPVVVARLDPGDVPEDEAAAALAAAVAGPGVHAATASTGRANLHADAAGVLAVDREAIDAVNRVDEALTLGTLSPFAPVSAGEMVATIKVIPFAVPRSTLHRALAAARRAGAPLVRVSPFSARRAGLVLTRLPGMSEGLLDRAAAAQATRMERLGGGLVREHRCAHRPEEVTRALRALVDEDGADLLLVMGASAIVDRGDVLPQAVEAAGGQVDHLGMPVDPGNLLLLGRVPGGGDGGARGASAEVVPAPVPVIGVPGCARSLRESGFDWVLARICAGLPVDGAAIMGMGAGGLLKEVAARPQPRQAPPRIPELVDGQPRAPRLAAVVLAAGQSRRMGDRNKLLEEVGGQPMVAHVVDALLATQARPVVVVVGHEADRVRAALAEREVRFVDNPEYAAGMSTSLRAGIGALLDQHVDGAFVALGDMPWVRPAHLEALGAAFAPALERSICVPVHQGKRGNPVLWAASYFPEMMAVEGDVGARALLRAHDDQLALIPVDDAAVHVDVDTPEDLVTVNGSRDPRPAGR